MIYNDKTKPSGQYFSVIMLSEVVPHFKSVSERRNTITPLKLSYWAVLFLCCFFQNL